MTDCAIESENVRARERKQLTQLMIFFELRVIFSYTHTKAYRYAKYSAFLLEIERERANPSTREHSKFEREKESAFVFFTAHFGGYFVQRTESLLKGNL